MLYIFIDESGDIGNPNTRGNSRDFSLAACLCSSYNIEYFMKKINQLRVRLKKKELKFSKISIREKNIANDYIQRLFIEHYSVYRIKSNNHYGPDFLKDVFRELLLTIPEIKTEKVKVFVDGNENSHFRKIYEPPIRIRLPKATLHFANSIKTPLIQVADFYAGQRRKSGK